MRFGPLAFLVVFLLVPHASFATTLTPNQGAVKFRLLITRGDGMGASIDLNLTLAGGDFTGQASISPRTKLDFSGSVKGYFENGRCFLKVDGPNGRTLELSGACTSDSYSGRFESHGRGDRVSGEFKGIAAAAPAAAVNRSQISLPTTKLICGYMKHTGTSQYELAFSNMGSITLTANGTYVAGTGVRGNYVREGDKLRLTSGNWKGYVADVDLDRSGDPKLVFRSIDPGITSCTIPRK